MSGRRSVLIGVGARADRRPTPSAIGASSLLAGLVAGAIAPKPWIGAACALLGMGLAAGRGWRTVILPAAAGLLLAWLAPARATELPADIDPRRPIIAVVGQRGVWERGLDGWRLEVRVATVRQGATVRRWPTVLRLHAPRRLAGGRWALRGRLTRAAALANGPPARASPWRLDLKSPRLAEQLPETRVERGLRAVADWRAAASRRLAAGSPSAGTALARALVLGEKEALAEVRRRGLRRAGLAHLTALSGLHLGVLAGWCGLLVRRARPSWRWALVGLVTLFYLALGGARPSLVRSWLMVAAAAAAALSRRPSRSLHALLWAAAGLAALSPPAVLDLGFQLTFAASAGVILGTRELADGGSRRLARLLAPTLGAQLLTAPLTLGAFAWLPLWGWCWNLFMVPVVALALPVAFLWAALELAAPSCALPARLILDLAAGVLALPALLPPGILGGSPWGQGAAAAALASVGGWCALRRPRRALLIGLALLAVSGVEARDGRRGTAVHVLDVGQGDALLIRDGGAALLVDGGGGRAPGIAERALLPALGFRGVHRLEVVVLTHGDLDHCRGVVELAGYLSVGEVWLAPAAALSPCGRRLALLPGVRLRPLWAGHEVSWRQWHFAILNPPAGRRGGNEESLVMRAESRGRSLMLTGDIGHRTEFEILQRAQRGSLRSDLLKVAHHGSATSSSRSFLEAVDPVLAIVSAGRHNPFGHPAPRVVERFANLGIPLLRTDLVGQIEVGWGPGGRLELAMPGPAGSP